MNDAELSKLRKLASQALSKAITHLETTAEERRTATLLFENKIRKCEEDRKIGAQLPQSLH